MAVCKMENAWDYWVEEALSRLNELKLIRSLRPIYISTEPHKSFHHVIQNVPHYDDYEVFSCRKPWDRSSVELTIAEATFQRWVQDVPSSGDEDVFRYRVNCDTVQRCNSLIRLLLFSGNDYLGLSSHPMIGKAATKVIQKHGMGPRGSALICGYTNYHSMLESSLAELKKKEDCLLCPTGFASNMALMVAIGNISSLLASGKKATEEEKIAIFSDSLNHASIIDGIRLAEQQRNVNVFVYRHCDMSHLNEMLLSCTLEKKVVVTDSMDGDFAPMKSLVKLRKIYGFLLAVDDAHGTFVCGKDGGGVPEMYNCEKDVDICVGTLSKAAGCHGGFIACSKRWKQLIQSRGRSFIFSTAIPIPIIAAAHAAVVVAKKESWRRTEIWNRVHDFQALTGLPITSPIISLIVGTEEKALETSRHLLKSGLHVTAIRPPTVPSNSCRVRVTLCAAHTKDDVKKLVAALSQCVNFQEISVHANSIGSSKL